MQRATRTFDHTVFGLTCQKLISALQPAYDYRYVVSEEGNSIVIMHVQRAVYELNLKRGLLIISISSRFVFRRKQNALFAQVYRNVHRINGLRVQKLSCHNVAQILNRSSSTFQLTYLLYILSSFFFLVYRYKNFNLIVIQNMRHYLHVHQMHHFLKYILYVKKHFVYQKCISISKCESTQSFRIKCLESIHRL